MKQKRGRKIKENTISSKKKKEIEEIVSESEEEAVSAESEVDEYENESAHERRIRLTKKAIEKAKMEVGSDDEDYSKLSLRLREEALLAKGKFLAKISSKIPALREDQVHMMKGHKKSVSCVCISEDSRFAFSGGRDSSVIKWQLSTKSKMHVFRGGKSGTTYPYHTGPVLSIAISTDGKYLASASMDKSVIVWNPEDMKVVVKLERHRAPVTAVSFRRHSHMLFTADSSGRVCVWNMPLTEVLQDQGARTNIEVLGLSGLTSERCVSCTGFGAPGISLWKVVDEVCVQYNTKNPLETSIECVYAINDEVFVGGSSTNTLYVWHSGRGSPVCTISPAHPPATLLPPTESVPFVRPVANWVTAVTGLYGTDLFASGSSTGHVQLWRISQPSRLDQNPDGSGQPIQRSQITVERLKNRSISLGGFINSLCFTPDRQYLVVAVGQEHRLGNWEPRRPVTDALCLIPLNLPSESLSREP